MSKLTKKPSPSHDVKKKASSSNTNSRWLLLIALVITTFIVFFPSLNNNFTNWDDDRYVINNTMLAKPYMECAKYYFNNIFFNNYHPITMMVYAFENHHSSVIQGISTNPEMYHQVNLLFHLFNVLLVFFFIYFLSNKKIEVAFIAAMLFGIHPMHVESVAWVSELKDVLYSFFFLGGLITYFKYIGERELNYPRLLLYIFTFFLFILAVLAKPAALIFVFILILLDYYTSRKTTMRSLVEKLPFLIVSIILSIVTYKAQIPDAARDVASFSLFNRMLIGSYSLVAYLVKFIAPFNLSALHPYPIGRGNILNLSWGFYLAPIVVLAIVFGVYKSLKYSRDVVFGVLFFVINIVLVLQFITVGKALIAERYSYISYIGLFYLAGIVYSKIYHHPKYLYGKYIAFVFIVVGITFCYLSNARCKVWNNSETLWTDVLNQYPDNAEAHKNRGAYLTNKSMYDINAGKNDFDKAFDDFNQAIRLNPDDAQLFIDRANVYSAKEQYMLALVDYSKAIQLDTADYSVYLNRGLCYSQMERYDSAFTDWQRVLKHYQNAGMQFPQSEKLYQSRAFAYLKAGRFQDAVNDYSHLIELNNIAPIPNTFFFRGIAYFKLKNYDAALADNTKAIAIDGNYREAYYNRAQVYFNLKKYQQSLDDMYTAKRLGYDIDPAMIDEIKQALTAPKN